MSKTYYLTISLFQKVSMLAFLFGMIALTLPITSYAQTLRSGRVTQEDTGEPLEGATITIKGTAKATSTNPDGVFSIVANNNDILVVSMIGEETIEVNVGNRNVINVMLRVVATGGDEVIVTGYRTLRKTDFTGAVSQIRGEDLQKSPVADFSQALEGRVTGLTVNFADGQPGEEATFIIRGPNTLNNSPQPLFIIDGFQVQNFNPATLNMDDIESINFLKDASSIAIYGSRGANGVVVITTKRGRFAKPQIAYNASWGFNSNRKKMELLSPYEYLKLNLEWTPSESTIQDYFDGGKTLEDYKDVKGYDLQDLMFTKGKVQKYNLSVRGGNDMTKYLLSGSYNNQEGTIIKTGTSNYSGRLNMDNTITQKFRVNLSIDYGGVERRGPIVREGGKYGTADKLMYKMWAWRPFPRPGENLDDYLYGELDESIQTQSDFRINPLIDYQNRYLKTAINSFNGNISLIYEILKNLNIRSNISKRFSLVNSEFFYNDKTVYGMYTPQNVTGPYGGTSESRTNIFSNENILTYSPSLGKDNRLVLLGIQGFEKYNTKGSGYVANLFPFPNLGIPGIDEGTPYGPSSYLSETSSLWFSGKADFTYKSRYIVNLNFRADASSKFAPGNQWGYFPSAGVAWNMDKEEFLKNSRVISASKIRFSWGKTGNNAIPIYTPFAKIDYTLNTYPFNGAPTTGAIVNTSPMNKDVRWETTTTTDLGYELGLFKNRVSLELSIYRKYTKDLLYLATVPLSSGYSTAWKNIGSLENKGLEFELNTINLRNKDFEWRTNFNISFNKNKIVKLDEGLRTLLYNTPFEASFTQLYTNMIGQPTGMMMGYVWDGLYSVNDFYNPAPNIYLLKEGITLNGATAVAPGYIKYRDLNGDGQITPADITIIGRGQPIHTGGFLNSFRYKKFTLYALFSWSYGNDVYNANRHTFEINSNSRPFINQFASAANRWTFDNQNTDIPRAHYAGTAYRVNFYNSKFVEDGSYLRLKTVNLDYSLPAHWIRKIGMNTVNIYMSGQNLLTWTNYSGLDPQVSVSGNQVLGPGFDAEAYPPFRTYTFGIRGTF